MLGLKRACPRNRLDKGGSVDIRRILRITSWLAAFALSVFLWVWVMSLIAYIRIVSR